MNLNKQVINQLCKNITSIYPLILYSCRLRDSCVRTAHLNVFLSINKNNHMTDITSMAHFESNYNSNYSNYSSFRTSIVATIVLIEINGGSEQRYSSRLSGSFYT